MAWYSKLKSFIDSIFNVDISTISGNSSKIKVKAKNSIVVINSPEKDPISIDKDGSKISVNIAKLTIEQQKELGAIVKESYVEEGELLKENLLEYSGELDDYSRENPDKKLLEFFANKLPQTDFEILKVSLFMRSRFMQKENVSPIKADIVKRFGDRGKNIANLCSASYFEDFIGPLWDVIHGSVKQKNEADKHFNDIYELIIKNGLLAIFVHHRMSKEKLTALVQGKIDESKRYGFSLVSDYIYIHALSEHDVRTVIDWIEHSEMKVNIIARDIDFITVALPLSSNSTNNT